MDSKTIEALARLGITLSDGRADHSTSGAPGVHNRPENVHNCSARKSAVSIEPDG